MKHLRELSSLAGGERSIPSRTSGIQFQRYDGLTEFAIKRGVASRVRVRLPKDETVLSVNSGAGKVMVYWIGSVLGPGEGVYWVLDRECIRSRMGSVLCQILDPTLNKGGHSVKFHRSGFTGRGFIGRGTLVGVHWSRYTSRVTPIGSRGRVTPVGVHQSGTPGWFHRSGYTDRVCRSGHAVGSRRSGYTGRGTPVGFHRSGFTGRVTLLSHLSSVSMSSQAVGSTGQPFETVMAQLCQYHAIRGCGDAPSCR